MVDTGIVGAPVLIERIGEALNSAEIGVCLENDGVMLNDPGVILIYKRHAPLGISKRDEKRFDVLLLFCFNFVIGDLLFSFLAIVKRGRVYSTLIFEQGGLSLGKSFVREDSLPGREHLARCDQVVL